MNNITIIKAEDAGNLTICLTFNDNTKQTIDIGDFIRRHPHPQYNKYLDPRKFSRFTLENGNVVWGKNWDLIFPLRKNSNPCRRKASANIPPMIFRPGKRCRIPIPQ